MGDFNLEIERSVTVGNNLEFTKELISAKFQCDSSELPKYLCLLIEEKYIEYLASYWLAEAPEEVVKHISNNNILELIEQLNLVNTVVDCNNLVYAAWKNITNDSPSLLFTYSFLFNELCKTSSVLKSKESLYVNQFKFHCRQLLSNKCENIKNEQYFFELFLNLLKSSKSPKKIYQSIGLLCNVSGFENVFNFKKLLHNLTETKSTDDYFVKVQQSAKTIINQDDFCFIKDMKGIMNSYLDPPVLTEKNVDGRHLLEVSGKHIVVSKMKEKIEEMLNEKIEEVRFVNANVIHVDTELSAKIWHGKNIVVYAETAIVRDDNIIIWDVSGKDAAIPIDSSDYPTEEDGCGRAGAEGLNGESGGNVLLMVDVLKNGHNFIVKSCGGNASSGLDGKKGEDGTDGYYLDEKSFKREFPPVSKYKNEEKSINLEITKKYVVENFKYLEEFFVGNSSLGPMTKTEFESSLRMQIDSLSNFYFKVHTKNGCKITFSFYYGGMFDGCQSFLLHEGSFGGEGRLGGVGGKGGTKGLAGEVKILVSDSLDSNVTVFSKDGEEGFTGKPGSSGKPGKTGLDRAYKDYTVTVFNTWPKWVIPDDNENNKLRVSYCKKSTSESVYCGHNKSYADFIFRKSEFRQLYQFRRDVELNNELHDNQKTHVQCKKTICEQSIKEKYPLKLSSVELFNLSNVIEKDETTLSSNAIDEISESEHTTTELRVNRPTTYFAQNVDYLSNLKSEHLLDCNFTISPNSDLDVLSTAELIESVKRAPQEINNWTCMLKTRLNISQLQDLWETASTSKQLLTEEYSEQFKIGFCNKYQLAALEFLANTIESSDYCHTFMDDPIDIPLNSFNKMFTVNKESRRPVLEKFVVRNSCKDRKYILKEFKKYRTDFYDNQVLLNEILMLFLSECSSLSTGALEILQKVSLFRESNKCLLSSVLDAFKSCLLREKVNSIFDELYKGVVEKNNLSMVKFENQVQRDNFLSAIYDCYVREHKEQYKWDCIFGSSDNDILKCLDKYLLDYGSSSACYREFLAYYFETNILIYSISETNQVTMVHNHNTRADTSMHFLFLQTDNTFVLLNKNNDAIKLYNSQKSQGRLYNDMLINMDTFTDKEQFDTFVSSCQTSLDLYRDSNICKSLRISSRLINVSMEENNIRQILKAYHLESQTSVELSCRLNKLKHEYTGCEMVLHILALHFENEGKHISSKELMYVINFVLKCALTVPHVIPVVSWTLATQSQNQWLVELILLKFELNLRKPLDKETKSLWRKYLSKQMQTNLLMLLMEKICEENVNITEKNFEETIFLLSNISQAHVGLDEIGFTDWKYYLKNKFWAHCLMEVANWSKDVLTLASYHLLVLDNLVGFELCKELVSVLKERKSELELESTMSMVPNVFFVMSNKEVCLNKNLLELIKNRDVSHWMKVIEENCYRKGEERNVDKLVELIQNSGNTSCDVKEKLDNIAVTVKQSNVVIETITLHTEKYSKLQEWIPLLEGKRNQVNMSSFMIELKSHLIKNGITDNTFKNLGKALVNIFHDSVVSKPSNELAESIEPNQLLETLFAIVVRTVEIKHNIVLRDAQKLAIMTMLKSEKNMLSQISTGEGKSFIIVIFAIVKVLTEEQKKVDIITSSHVLAKRDAEHNNDIYNLFGINVGHNCSENIEERKQVYSNSNVVYGELANFQRDYLLHNVYKKNVFGDRPLNTIIVDEVDSMLLDKGNNTLYLSHEIPGLDKLEPVFILIWKLLHNPSESIQPKLELIVSLLKKRVLHELFGIVSKDNLKCLDTTIGDEIINTTWDYLVSEGFIDNNGKVLKQPTEDQFRTVPENCICETHLKFIFKKISGREKSLIVPNYLKQYVEDHLEEWIKNGVRAMTMEPGVDYVVDNDRSESRSPNIMIIDHDTGTDLMNSQWENGLHQFLQLKHGCRLSLMSLKAVFISNVSYLQNYTHLFGLTGTLGSEVERELLKDTYQVDFVTIPTAKTKLFTEELPIVCSSSVDWYDTICEEASKKTKQRSVLIVCETVNNVMTLEKKMLEIVSKDKVKHIHTYTRDHEDFNIADKLEPGHIIISTNLAGRGTDITLSEKLVEAGGLHVCLTYLPRNSRIEEQAFGRAARNGQPGSGQMIIFQNCILKNALTIIHLKRQRDINEVLRIAEIKDYHKSLIQIEESCLHKFSEAYSSLITKSSDPDIIESILLQVSLDQWAFWLERNSNSLDIESVSKFIKKISILKKDKVVEWLKVIKDPFHLIKLGLALEKQKDYGKAIKLFNRVIEKEPLFSEGAQYYRLYVNSICRNVSKKEIIEEMNIVTKQLTKQIDISSLAAYTIDCLKKKNPSMLQIESFKEQQLNVAKINGVFVKAIHNVVGQEIAFEKFILPTIMDEETAFIVFNDLVRSKVISVREIKLDISKKDLPFAVNYGILPEDLSSFLNKYKYKAFDEENILEKLKEKFLLPSREVFWSVLISKQILINEKTFCIVDVKKLNYVDPSLVNIVKPLKVTYMKQQNELWMYQQNEIGHSEDNCVFLRSRTLIEKIGELKYKYLLNKSIIYVNKLATLNEVGNNVQFDQYNSVRKEDFIRIGISLDTASNIICELEEQDIIKPKEKNGEYMLLVGGHDLVNMELSKFKAYSSDVVQLLKVCFSFKLALENLYTSKARQMENSKGLFISLPIRLHRKIINDLYEHEIVTKYVVNPEEDISRKLNELYPKAMPLEMYKKLFNNLYDEDTTNEIIGHLITSECLVKNGNLYSLNSTKDLSLPPPLKCYTETIKHVLKRQFDLGEDKGKGKKVKDHIEQIINCHASMLHKVENPTFSLQPLSNELKNYKLPSNECRIFSLNGFENILVLEEKKYTIKMIFSVFSVVLLGLAEIAAGVALSLLPVGAALISEGVCDIIYSMHSFYSGYFSCTNYFGNKAISLIISACWFLKPFEFFQSMFGSNLHSLSSSFMSSVNSKCSTTFTSTLFEQTKTFFSSIFQMKTASTVIQAADSAPVIVRHLAKQVVTQTAVACSIGSTAVTVDNVLEPQLKKLGEELVERIFVDIDDIDSHTIISHVKEIYLLLGEKCATKLIHICFSEVLDEYKTKIRNDFAVLYRRLITAINKEFANPVRQYKTISVEDSAALIVMLNNAIKKVNDIINISKKLLPMSIITKVLMNSLELIFLKKLDSIRKTKKKQPATDCEVNTFISRMLNDLENGIRSILTHNVHSSIVDPLLTTLKTKSSEYLINVGSDKCLLYKEEDLRGLIEQNEQNYKNTDFWQAEKLKYPSQENWYDMDYKECLLELFKRKRSIPIYLEILNNSSSVDESFIELCCSVIPLVLRQEGLNVPMLRVVVEKNGKQYIYGGSIGSKKNVVTITVSPEEAFLNNVQQNKILLRNVLHTTYKTIINLCPECKALTADMLHKLILSAAENDFYIQEFIRTNSIPTTDIGSISNCNTSDNINRKDVIQNTAEYENGKKSNTHSNSAVIKADYKVLVKTITQSQVVKRQVIEVFKTALAKINHHLQLTQPHFKHFNLTLEDFIERKHVIISNDTSERLFDSYAIGYDLTVPLMEPDTELLLDYNVSMKINDQCCNKQLLNSRGGSRIEYDIYPVNMYQSKHSDNCIKGHIPLDFECQSVEKIYSINQCRNAGELALPNLQCKNLNRKITKRSVC